MDISTRNATVHDLESINDIYNFYVETSTCTYQTEPETLNKRIEWFRKHGEQYPVIVAETAGAVAGWASLAPYHGRAAYKPTVENSVYVRHDLKRKGIGYLLLSGLLIRARSSGFHSVIAQISADQSASVRLHEKLAFVKVAHLKEVGYKFGRWLDVVFYQLIL
jgi:phosphinothricin acetyltransferase